MRLFVPKDLDGFFGLFVDNLVQLLLISVLCTVRCSMSGDHEYLLVRHILPGAAVSILIGNLFYAWQAHRLAKKEHRDDVTALPYGINTPSLLVYVFFVMGPIYDQTKDPRIAWQFGLLACLGSGLIEFFGSFVAERIRKSTPRAALLSTLAGIAIGFISMTFALQIWATPLVAMAPLAIVLLVYFSHVRFPLGLPGGFVAVVVGTILAWLLPENWSHVSLSLSRVVTAWDSRALYLPQWSGGVVWEILAQPEKWRPFLSVIIPMGLFNVLGSLQNIESAEAAGDRYATTSSLAVNGVGTIAAALFGSCFPTTIYIGHPGWKALGARAGYSTLNGLVITAICLTGTLSVIKSVVPIEAGIAIVLWIGIIITAQAFSVSPLKHAPAAAIGLFPAIAAWGQTVVTGAYLSVGVSLQSLLEKNPRAEVNGFSLHGLILLERGYIFTCMIVAALSACLIDRKFFGAAVWALLGMGFTLLGFCHAYQVSGSDIHYLLLGEEPIAGALVYRAYELAFGYGLVAAVLVVAGLMRPAEHEGH